MNEVKQQIHYWCPDTISGRTQGQGITVAVMDTGIVFHPDFDNRIVAFGDVIGNKTSVYDDNSHGTHVASIIGGNGRISQGICSGIAPKCRLAAIKVLDHKGNGTAESLIRGIQNILKEKERFGIRVVNISVGTMAHHNAPEEDALLYWVEKMWDEGIAVVAAAGNFGPGKGTITLPGTSRKVITVGSSDDWYLKDRYGKVGKNYSGRGPTNECVCKPDLVAPGSYVRACNGFFEHKNHSFYTVKSGTSMAAPVVSGAIALLLSKYPDMSNVEVKMKLWRSCDDLGLPENHQGHGILNIEKLLSLN